MGEAAPWECPSCREFLPPSSMVCDACGASWTEPEEAEDPAVVVRTYHGRTQADAAALFHRDATRLAGFGYRPVSQSWADGRPGVGRMLALGLWANSIRPDGTLTVTYALEASSIPPAPSREARPSPPPGPTESRRDTPDLASRLRQLNDARDAGLVTDEEYATKRAALLDDL